MRKALVTLVATLVVMTTPMLATANNDGRRGDGARYDKGWVIDRHDHGRRYGHDHDRKWERREIKHLKKHAREHRREHRREASHSRHCYDHVNAVKVIRAPQVVFRIGW